ncbi:hypothetical protein NLJ89_g10967 [Agrocybe chaxingu]|uniref:Integrase catalytic domain-containing protein n=1 Tax=Agrocybe chaxingu TaxID=84603 RepID=A0A9W8JPL2_9AGAR|nr:hypothetical protein NLJ89_g10967 [Agrocybe chaxingu]
MTTGDTIPPVNMSPPVLETDAMRPSVPLIQNATLFSGKKLDKLKGNWEEWKEEIYPTACMSGLWGYMSGSAICPNKSSEPRAHTNWVQNDERACAFLYDAIEVSERRATGGMHSANAAKYWTMLKERHEMDGPVSQVYLIKDALGKRASDRDAYTTGLDELFNMVDHAWRMGDITLDILKSIAALNYFSKADVQKIQFDLQDRINGATKEKPFTPNDIRWFVEECESLIKANARQGTTDAHTIALNASVQDKKQKDNNVCTNCKKPGHTVQYCISPNGGMAGKTITESKTQCAKDREAKNSKPTPTTSTTPTMITRTVKDESTGAVYLVCMPEDTKPIQTHALIGVSSQPPTRVEEIDTIVYSTDDLERGEAVWGYSSAFMAIGENPIMQVPTEAPKLDQIDPTDTTHIHLLNSADFITLLPVEHVWDWSSDDGCFRASVDWNLASCQVDIAAIVVEPLHQSQSTPISTDTCPFYVDTGATAHISPDRTDFITLRPSISAHTIKGVGGSFITAIGCGDIKLRISRGKYLIFEMRSLFPLQRFALSLYPPSSLILTQHFSLTMMHATSMTNQPTHSSHTARSYQTNDFGPWISTRQPQNMPLPLLARQIWKPGIAVWAMPTTKPSKRWLARAWSKTRTPVPKKREEGKGHRATRRLEKVWVDLSGPMAVTSRCGHNYAMNIVDDYSSFVWTVLLSNKAEAFPKLQVWERAREAETGLKVGTYRTDNGELKSTEMEAWLQTRGVDQEFTAPHTSAHIGRVERMHRTLMGKAQSMRHSTKLPPSMWHEFYLTATHTHVRTGTSTLEDVTPFEKWYGRKPNCSYLREIGCRAFVLILNKHNPKLYERSVECILIGYNEKSKTYRCYDKKTHQVYSSYHVRFIKSQDEPFLRHDTEPKPTSIPTSLRDVVQSATPILIYHDPEEEEEFIPTSPSAPLPAPPPPRSADPLQQPIEEPRQSDRLAKKQADKEAGVVKPTHTDTAVRESREAGERVRAARTERRKTVKDLQQEESANSANAQEETAIDELCDAFNKISIDTDQNLGSEEIKERILAAITEHTIINPRNVEFADDPKDWHEAQSSPHASQWEAAYRNELKSLKDCGVYTLVPCESIPTGMKVRKCRPIFKIKRNEDRQIDRFKVRVVFKGFEQIYRKDYTSTTSPTARMESWRILLHIGSSLNWDARQIDVKTAFLYGLLPDDETQYMEQPEGFEETDRKGWVWKLQRGLYGMKQSGRIWNQMMNEAMIGWGFTKLVSEPCIYYQKTDNGTIIATVHVDDFLSIADPARENDTFEKQMQSLWEISSGPVKFCIGIAINRNIQDYTVCLSQTALIDKTVLQFGQLDAHPISIPMDPGLKLHRPDPKDITLAERSQLDKLPYRSLVGCLIYLAIGTRPDISYAVQQLSQFLDCYTYAHWNAATRCQASTLF